MKPISELGAQQLKNIKLLCFDVDGVIVEKGTQIRDSGGQLSITTNLPTPSIIKKLHQLQSCYHLVFNSGRNHLHLIRLFSDLLWDNISFISEIGTFIVHQGQLIQTQTLDNYELDTSIKIHRGLEELLDDPRVKGFEPKTFLTSFHCSQEVPEVEAIVKQNDPKNRFYCWWNLEAYDINPKKFNKEVGLQKLLEMFNLSMNQVITVGNGVNDSAMSHNRALNITTDPQHLPNADFFAPDEHLGGEVVIDHLLQTISL